jgi:hypothetical protein
MHGPMNVKNVGDIVNAYWFSSRAFKSCLVQLRMSGMGGLLEIESYSIHQAHLDKPITL